MIPTAVNPVFVTKNHKPDCLLLYVRNIISKSIKKFNSEKALAFLADKVMTVC